MRLWALAAVLLFCLAPAPAQAQGDPRSAEVRIKAAFLVKFSDFIEWPAGAFAKPDSPLTIGVVDADPLADELAQVVVRRTVQGRPVVVRKLRRGASLAGIHVLFVGGQGGGRLSDVLAGAKGQPTLTVTEADEPAAGGMINFVLVDAKVRFDVALPAAEEGNLKISSRLLAVARKVVAGPS